MDAEPTKSDSGPTAIGPERASRLVSLVGLAVFLAIAALASGWTWLRLAVAVAAGLVGVVLAISSLFGKLDDKLPGVLEFFGVTAAFGAKREYAALLFAELACVALLLLCHDQARSVARWWGFDAVLAAMAILAVGLLLFHSRVVGVEDARIV
jgi:hypothetical protein